MNKRPFGLSFLFLFSAMVAASFPFQILFQLHGVPLSFIFSLQAYTALNLCVMTTGAAHAYFCWQAHRGLLITGMLFSVFIIWNNAYVAAIGSFSVASYAVLGIWLSILFQGAGIFNGSSLKVLRRPELRWWKAAKRRRVAVPVVVQVPTLSEQIIAQTFDLSETGAFIVLTQDQKPQLVIGTACQVSLLMGPALDITCSGRIVRHSEARGRYPEGWALEFINLRNAKRRVLKTFLGTRSVFK